MEEEMADAPKREPSNTADEPVTPGRTTPDPAAPATIAAGPQAEAAVMPREPPAIAPNVLSGAERHILTAVLDCIIPASDSAPGAGAIGVAAMIERTLAASPTLRRLFLDGLVAIEAEAARQNADSASSGFVALNTDRQVVVLRAVEEALPAFFAALVDHTYRGYYTDPRVYAAIGYDHRPPQPLGHFLPPFDPASLEKQRQRAPFWRRTS
jgi:hypothetical protein